MASTGIERQSSVAERLAILTARSKHIDGAGYGTTRADPMLLAGAMAGLTEIQRELMHAKYMLDYRAYAKLVQLYAVQVAREYALELDKATAVSRAAVHCVVNGVACKACHGTGVTPEQKECPKCEGLGMKAVSDRRRAQVAGIPLTTWQRNFAEIADVAENQIRRIESSAVVFIAESF